MKKIDKSKIKTWFVTGASSGVGYELCKQLLDRGYNVIAVSRRVPDFESSNALCLSVDVTKPETIQAAIDKGIEKFGRIDVLSNNAGISSYLTVEEEPVVNMRNTMEVNFWGTYNTIHCLLPYFRNQQYGTIINNSSECGLTLRAFGAAYCSSKHAIEGLSSVLWYEAHKFCRVMTVELAYFPGTAIGKGKPRAKTLYDVYKGFSWYPISIPTEGINSLSKAIECIIKEIEKEKIQRRLMLGAGIKQRVIYEVKSIVSDLKDSEKYTKYCIEKEYPNLLAKTFSIQNSKDKKHKIIQILGLKVKIRRKK